MKVLAYMPIHYGKQFLREAILAIHPHVDKIIIFYTKHPSYGHNAHLTAPETENELRQIAFGASTKIMWSNGSYGFEGHHRSQVWEYSKGYDLILPVDADEVWDSDILRTALDEAITRPEKQFGVDGFVNFWKSFNEVCIDSYRPIRIINPNGQGTGEIKGKVYHFGYCISEKLMRYKWEIHGHKDELIPNWIDEVYLSDRKNDLHPVAHGIWNAEPFDKNTLPEILKIHPDFNKENCT